MTPDVYFSRHGFCPVQIKRKPPEGLGAVIVIPCYNELSLIPCFESLWRCKRPKNPCEVIAVINASEKSPSEVLLRNDQAFTGAKRWIQEHKDSSLSFHLIRQEKLPDKHAGVGLARKIGMDEAISRFQKAGNPDGIIVCYDCDCTCDDNYLVAVEEHFLQNRDSPGCSIYFEHLIEGNVFPVKIYDGILLYELFLRYYRYGLKYAGLPYAFHTIGSCMAVRSGAYMKAGGMNRRKAGEDFYFLNKIMLNGRFTEINSTCVYPSPRPSDRVPFGTGKAITDWLKMATDFYPAYDPRVFYDLSVFNKAIRTIDWKNPDIAGLLDQLPPSLVSFLNRYGIDIALDEISGNCSSQQSFLKRFYRWFDGLMALKFAHYARDNFYENIPVEYAARRILERQDGIEAPRDVHDLLIAYRRLDRQNENR